MRRSLIARVILIAVAMAVGCGDSQLDELSHRWKDPEALRPTQPKGLSDREEVFETMFDKRLLKGLSSERITALLGRPREVSREPPSEYWMFTTRTDARGRCDRVATVLVERGRVTGLVTNGSCE